MGRVLSARILALTVLLVPVSYAGAQKNCSTETVNNDCTIIIDRSYPVAPPTIQMRRHKKVTVVVVKPLVFESLSLDPQSGQAVAGTDQTAGFITAALPNIKAFVGSVRVGSAEMRIAAFERKPSDSAAIIKIRDDLKTLQDQLDAVYHSIDDLLGDVTPVYLQLQEIVSAVPRPVLPVVGAAAPKDQVVRAAGIPENTPFPWTNYTEWRQLVLCELATGKGCPDSTSTKIDNVLGRLTKLQANLPTIKPDGTVANGGDSTIFDGAKFDTAAKTVQDEIQALCPTPDSACQAEQTRYTGDLERLKAGKSNLSNYSGALSAIAKDLSSYYVNIDQVGGTVGPGREPLGEIHDPQASSKDGACANNLLGCQVSFSVNAVNEISTFVASVPTSAQKKSIATITVLYADPIFEVSAGAFFSTLPNRSFLNQTTVSQNPGGSPTPGDVVITQTITRPTIVPFVAANWRLKHDFAWPDHRRGAFYLTTMVGLNPNNTTAEFGIGPSLSWRSVMFSPVLHIGHDVRLTQGEFVGEVWCNQTAAHGSVPKCSGNPPSPSTERFWKSAFALGVSVRIPSVFGGGSH